MTEAKDMVATRDPDVLLKEIERTRESLARTVDELADRVSPANLADRALDRVREQLQRPEARIAGGALAALTVIGVTAYLLRRRHR